MVGGLSGVRLLGAKPDLQQLRAEAAARGGRDALPTLAAAEQLIAREHGFASWRRLADEVDARALNAAARAEALVGSACSSDLRRARTLLAADPALARHDIATACVTGETAELAVRLEAAPELAWRPASPFGWEPILYACFSRFLRVEPRRARGIRDAVGLLLAYGADPNACFDHEGWLQVPLYGAAGIANDPLLTELLLDAGAEPNDAGAGRPVGEALYHAVEFSDPSCARLLVRAGTARHVVDHALGRALNFPRLALVEMLCAEGARPSAAQLHQAVRKRRAARTVGVLLAAGAPVDEPGEDGLTPLRIAVR